MKNLKEQHGREIIAKGKAYVDYFEPAPQARTFSDPERTTGKSGKRMPGWDKKWDSELNPKNGDPKENKSATPVSGYTDAKQNKPSTTAAYIGGKRLNAPAGREPDAGKKWSAGPGAGITGPINSGGKIAEQRKEKPLSWKNRDYSVDELSPARPGGEKSIPKKAKSKSN